MSKNANQQQRQRTKENFLRQFRDEQSKELKQLTAAQFMEIWSHYDTDGNGYIEGHELDDLLRELASSVNVNDAGPELIPDSVLRELKECFLEAYDENEDGKIEIGELAEILPTDENFLLLFRKDNPLDSSVEFMKVWKQFDTDCSGFIEADELKQFIKALLTKRRGTNLTEEKLIEYTDTILHIFDTNGDGKLQFSEMTKLLPVKENFLLRPIFKGCSSITSQDLDRVFQLYDKDGNQLIEEEELDGFVKDLMDLIRKDYDNDDLQQFKQSLLNGCDYNRDKKISKAELKMILLALAQPTDS
ncbi:unnamed protein product [Rotaria sp. Silwood1]|nr:unnamed protein product [Rotaria sp. Silwood1]CAF1334974.1 unnamed protein product [Rotaria sp. Silwood1]CAF1336744.1 unnamed protein product [Rotaria sp. Silwood1]CAF3563577.1 unnamed protein product [Rotaria sp. Silwood1]CAF3583845.1 unnamed protein product [Rotaria sp. Silwood1]